MRVSVDDIKYDTDGEDVKLPSHLQVNIPDTVLTKEEAEEFISDEISNQTGYCHTGFTVTPELDTLY